MPCSVQSSGTSAPLYCHYRHYLGVSVWCYYGYHHLRVIPSLYTSSRFILPTDVPPGAYYAPLCHASSVDLLNNIHTPYDTIQRQCLVYIIHMLPFRSLNHHIRAIKDVDLELQCVNTRRPLLTPLRLALVMARREELHAQVRGCHRMENGVVYGKRDETSHR